MLVHTTDKGEPVYADGSWIYLLDGGGLSAILPPNASADEIAAAVGRRL